MYVYVEITLCSKIIQFLTVENGPFSHRGTPYQYVDQYTEIIKILTSNHLYMPMTMAAFDIYI